MGSSRDIYKIKTDAVHLKCRSEFQSYHGASEPKQFMAEDESKEIDAKVCEDIPHFTVCVHGTTDYFCWNPRKQESSS